MWYLQSNRVAQVVHLITSICAQEYLFCLSAQSYEHGGDTRRQATIWEELDMAVERHLPICRIGLCSFVRGGTWGALPEHLQNDLQQATGVHVSDQTVRNSPWGWDDGPMSSSGTCAHSPALCSSTGICEKTPELAGPPLAPHSLHRWEQVHTEHMWQAWKSLETPWWTLCCL